MPTRRRSRSSKNRNGERVLIVDDHALSRKALVVAMRLLGYVCHAAQNAEDALAAVEQFKPTAIVFEWCYRDGSGVGLAKRMRDRSSVGEKLVMIVVSTINEPEDFLAAEGVDAYFSKPCSADVIDEAIRRVRASRP